MYIPITRITFTYRRPGNREVNARQFKSAFTAYLAENMKKKLAKKEIPLNLAFNRNENGDLLVRYSLIQYRSFRNRLEIVGIAQGSKLVKLWLKDILKHNIFLVDGDALKLSDIESHTQYWLPALLKEERVYKITGWKPFNNKTIGDETKFDAIIWGNIFRFFDDLGVKLQKKPTVKILQYKRREMQQGYKIKWITYDVVFAANVNLPRHIGIGHEVSIGSGKIKFAEWL